MQVNTSEKTTTQPEAISYHRVDELCLAFIKGRGFESQNPYHNIEHIRDVVSLCDLFCSNIEFKDQSERELTKLTVKCAAWFHDMSHSGKKGVEAEQENISAAISSFGEFWENTPEINSLGNNFKMDVIRLIRSTTHPYIVGFNDVLSNADEQILRDADNLSVWALPANTTVQKSWIPKVEGLLKEMYPDEVKIENIDKPTEKAEIELASIVRLINLETGFLNLLKSGKLKIYTKSGMEFFNVKYPTIISDLNNYILDSKQKFPDSVLLQNISLFN